MGPPQKKGWKSMTAGAVLQCAEAASLGMPFEVWKTYMGRHRDVRATTALANIYKQGGILRFWAGTGPKMVESALKGAVLLYSKEMIKDGLLAAGLEATPAGLLAGAGGGICQTVVMAPCTMVVTGVVNGKKPVGTIISETMNSSGVRGFYAGGSAVAFRQMTNWASRQGFTEWSRFRVRDHFNPDLKGQKNAKLTPLQEAMAGVMGGAMACWNHPFEVARIEMQSRQALGEAKLSMVGVWKSIVAERGPRGLFSGLTPRLCLGIWQTLFMVSIARIVRDKYGF